VGSAARYAYDTLSTPLLEDNIVDYKTVKRDFVSKSATGDLNMNGNLITELGEAVLSDQAMTLGQLPSHHYAYLYKTANQAPASNEFFVQFEE